jgi:hypothetical protein
MSNYKGAKYIGLDSIHLFDGSLIMNGEITEMLSEEAAINDNNFEPVYEIENTKEQRKEMKNTKEQRETMNNIKEQPKKIKKKGDKK